MTADASTTFALAGYLFTGTDEQRQQVQSMLAESMRPAPREVVGKALVKLRMLTASRDPGATSTALMMAAYADELADLPGDAVMAGIAAWPRTNKFWPTLAELRAECAKHCEHRLMIAEAVGAR